jgi:hypothetical protein
VSTIRHWSKPTAWETVCRRASARRQFNAMKTFLAERRRRQVLERLDEAGLLSGGHGVEAPLKYRCQKASTSVAKSNALTDAPSDGKSRCSFSVRSTINTGSSTHPGSTHSPGSTHPPFRRVASTDVWSALGLKCLPPLARCEQMRRWR